jgi:hypothetical protein
VDLSFEEGIERINIAAFYGCSGLKAVAFPASLVVIDESAFRSYRALCEVTFAADSKLQCIGKEDFKFAPLERICLPASASEIDPSAFSAAVGRILTFDGPSPPLLQGDFVHSPDSETIQNYLSHDQTIVIPAHIEVIGKGAFRDCFVENGLCANGSRLREIGREAFSHCENVSDFTVSSSVEILGDRCFRECTYFIRVSFEEPSKLKNSGEQTFAFSLISSVTIPASTTEIDGSAFLGCPLLKAIDIASGNRRFIIRDDTLFTSDGTEIVKSFGLKRRIFIPRDVEVLQDLCFVSFEHLTEVNIESGSKLRMTGRSALSCCESLRRILLPASLSDIEESAFKDCIGLEECSIHKDAILVKIGMKAFAGCCCLRSFYVPRTVDRIGENCFKKCSSLSRLKFGSGDTLKRFANDMTLDEALEHLGVSEISRLFRVEAEDDDFDLSFPGWISAADEGSHLTLTRDFS